MLPILRLGSPVRGLILLPLVLSGASDAAYAAQPLAISGPTSLPAAAVLNDYNPVAFSATGGSGGYIWNALGLPPGMALSPAGVLSGRPLWGSEGSYLAKITVTDASNATASTSLPLLVRSAPMMTLPLPAGLQSASVNVPYGPHAFAITGGTAPYSIAVSGLPPGISASPTGVLSGMPTTAGAYFVDVVITDLYGTRGKAGFSFGVSADPSPLSILGPASVPAGQELVSYGPVAFTAGGGTLPLTWTATGLPGGITMSPAGWLGGVPGAGSQGSHSIAIQVRDAQGRSAHATLVLTIREGALAVQPVALPAGTLGAPYGPVALSASGGKSPYTWSAGSALPVGMTLSAAGVLGGTPAAGAAGAHSVSVTVRDSAGASSSLALALTIQLAQQPLKITSPATLPAGSEKAPYEATFTAAGGTGAYSWSATGLPSGLNMVATGALSGTPAQGARGTYSVQVTVRDSSQATAVITFPLTIHAGLEIASPASLPPATAGSAMIPVAFTATGGTAPYAWSATATPAGVSMSAGGVLAGTPSGAPGVYQILVAVTDSAGATATAKAPLTVLAARPPLSITGPHSLPVALAGSPYGPIFFAAQGGTAPYNWQVAGGSLPGGVTLTAGGQLSGTPASGAAGNYPLTIQTTDAAGATAKVSLAITVQAVLSPLTITTTSLPDGATTNSYGPVALTASGGSGTGYTWSGTGLPPGLSISPAGMISGMPGYTSAGTYQVTIMVQDLANHSQTATLPLTIRTPPRCTSPFPPQSAQVGVPYGPHPIHVSGGSPPYSFVVTGGFPNGVALSSGGVLSGTPSPGAEGDYSLAFRLGDSLGFTSTCAVGITVTADPAPLTIAAPSVLPSGMEQVSYGPMIFSASGGTGTRVWSAAGLPQGVTMSATGALGGTPAKGASGAYSVAVTVRDGLNRSAAVTLPLVINSGSLLVSPPALPPGLVGTAYGPVTLSATGGTAPYTFTAGSGLPNGLTLSPAGTLGGAPAAGSEGSYTLTVTVRDAAGASGAASWILPVQTSALAIAGMTGLPPGRERVAYPQVRFSATGGSGGYTWAASGLPAGLSVSPDGVLGGTPARDSYGTYTVEITVRDASLKSDSVTLPLAVYTNPRLAFAPPLPPAQVGVPYRFTLTAAAGVAPYTWTSSAGPPPGLVLSTDGLLSGAPTTAGSFEVGLTVTDAHGYGMSTSVAMTITAGAARLAIHTPVSFPNGIETVNHPGVYFTASGGTGGYVWSAAGLPSGLAIYSTTAGDGLGVVNGTPAAGTRGSYTVEVTVTDAGGATASITLPLLIQSGQELLIASPQSLGPYTESGGNADVVFTAHGGTPPYTWSAMGLPPGMTFTPGGILRGKPAAGSRGAYPARFTVQDSRQETASVTISIVVSGTVQITGPDTLPAAAAGTSYGPLTFTAGGGSAPYTWSATGALPQGLAFSPNGVLSGVPAAGSAGSYPVTIRVADFMGSTAQVQLALLVEASPSSLAVAGPRSLPAAQELLAFGPVTLTASGGSGGYVWGGSGLPAGLTLSPGGVLGGAPAAGTRGTHTVHVTVRDSSGNVASSTMSLVVETPALTVSHSVLPAGATGAPYGPLTLTATGGQPPYAWTVLDGLPNGMALSPHGVLSGAPAPGAAGNYTLSIQVSDGRGIATATRLTLTIAAPPPAPISITCSLPGPEETGKPYASTCVVVGGTPRYHWSLTGSLPAGLTFDPLSGSVTGIPLVSGAYQYTIKVTDSSQPALVASESFGGAVRPLSFTVSPASFLFVSRAGAPAPAQRLSIGPGGFSYTVAVPAEACGWLRVSPDSGEAPALLDVGIDAAGLAAGTHHCTIAVIVNGVAQDVSVTATVAGPSLTLSPPFAVFTSQAGGAAPAPQTIAVSATDGAAVDFSAASACPWLTVTQAGSSTPAALVLSVEPAGLVDSNYRCPVILTASETTAPRLTATLQIHSDRLRVSPQTVVLNAAQGSTVPVVAALQLTGPERPVSFATTIDSDGGGNWLSAEVTSSATTPTTIRLQASPLGLAAGSYAAVVHMASPAGEIAVPVKFTITPVTVRAAPSRLAFRGPQGGSWPAQVISVTGDDGAPAAFTLQASSRLRVSPGPGAGNFSVSVASGLGPGVYADNAVTVLPSLSGAPPQVVPAIITVEAPPAPLLRVSADALTLAAVQGGPAATQLLLATHQGASWTPQVTAGSSGGAWLTASIPAGVAPAGAPVPIRVSADPSKVPANSGGSQAGVYAGEVVVADAAGQEMRVDVTLVVSPAATLSLSRHGLSFSAVKGGTGAPDEMIDLFNPGLRALAWSASATTLAGGDWLKLAHASGVCPAGFAGHMTVQVDPAAVAVLTPGWYYGSVEVRARDAETGEDAVNSPQSVSVALQVLPEATQFSPRARPGALLFSAAAGSANVPARVVTIHSASPRTMRYTAAVATDGGDGWCQVSPAFGSFYGSTAVSVNADFSQLTAGLHDCVINLAFSDGASQAVHVTAAAGSTSSPPKARMAAQEGGAGCTAPGLVVSQREPFSGAALAAFQPAGLEVEVRDACGNAVDDAGVIVSFSTPEPAAVLKPVGDGLYRGSWAPVPEWRNLPGVEVMMEAAAQRGAGETAAAGRARAVSAAVRLGAPHPPHIARDGVVNSTSLTPGAWVAPCTWITIFGENFARGEALADAAPLPLELQDVRVFLGGRPIPMAYAAEGQINAQIPCDIQANSEQSIWIVSGATRSLPVNIVVASAQPSILPADRRGSGPADAFRIQTDGQHVTVDAANPAGEGDLIGIYCTGLGPVAPAVPAGARSPGEPLPTVLLPVSATIGGKPAKVEWAGLMPGGIGVYQVNVRVPPGVEKDDAAPLAIVVDGYSSQPGITIAVR